MPHGQRIVVTRKIGKSACAIIDVDTQEAFSPEEVKKRIRAAVTAWTQDSRRGKAAFIKSGRDFTVEDLAEYATEFKLDPDLWPHLVANGITDLRIAHPVSTYSGWDYDDKLVSNKEKAKTK